MKKKKNPFCFQKKLNFYKGKTLKKNINIYFSLSFAICADYFLTKTLQSTPFQKPGRVV